MFPPVANACFCLRAASCVACQHMSWWQCTPLMHCASSASSVASTCKHVALASAVMEACCQHGVATFVCRAVSRRCSCCCCSLGVACGQVAHMLWWARLAAGPLQGPRVDVAEGLEGCSSSLPLHLDQADPIFFKQRCCAVQLWASDTLALRSQWCFFLQRGGTGHCFRFHSDSKSILPSASELSAGVA
jgi:hypothetical protein